MKEILVGLGCSEELADNIVNNFGKVIDGKYVSKDRFNEVNTELTQANKTIKERDTQLDELKNNEATSEELKAQLDALTKTNKEAAKEYELKLAAEKKSNAIKLALVNDVHNADVTLSLLDLNKVTLGDDGTVVGLKEQLEGLKQTNAFLFKEQGEGDAKQSTQTGLEQFIRGVTPKGGDNPDVTVKPGSFGAALAKTGSELSKNANHYFNK